AFVVRLGYFVHAVQVDGSGVAVPAWDASCEWLLDYVIAEGASIDAKDGQAFAELNGAFSVHPYAREFFQRVSGQMGYPPLILSVMQSPLDVPTESVSLT
ncbi:MAG TPA: hypothetical protein VMH41_04380, partial [Mycobacteriales bacterium]|nr:hypothetical protein [Mycobacteriales bacterium]